LFAIERRKKIITIIEQQNSIAVSELSKRMGVSVVTIRKDLETLEADGLVTRTYGGVILGGNPLQEEVSELRPEYSPLILEAAKFIVPGQTIMLGGGKNIVALAEYLKNYPNNLTIITTSVEVAMTLLKALHIDVILTGGILRARTMTMLGHLTERVIKEICFDLSFSEVDGIHPQHGITSANIVESSTEAAVLKYSSHPIILVEEGAIGKIASAQIATFKPDITVIVEGHPDVSIVGQLKHCGLKLIQTGFSGKAGDKNVDR
jgi:DeoR/GlpR family transcriptional regulator of sugar metabolism